MFRKMRAKIVGLLCGALIFASCAATPVAADTFEQQLAAFPARYHAAIQELHELYPNWTFVPDLLSVKFADAVREETVFPRKLVPASYNDSLKSMTREAYDWSTATYRQNAGSWVGAAKEVIAYQMDPLTYLNYNDAYAFALQSYTGGETKEILIEHGIKNTFLNADIPVADDYKTYADAIMAAAQQSGVNPYMLASTIIQEQGTDGASALISGTYAGAGGKYKGYYNFFNIGASGKTQTDVVENGLKQAMNEGWSTPSKAIIGGAKYYAKNYIAVGQNTYYYKNFNVKNGNYNHQYAQNVYDTRNSATKLRGYYINESNAALTLLIPVYQNMPEIVEPPVNNTGKNNYYFNTLTGANFSPAFDSFSYEYVVNISGDTKLGGTFPQGASYVGQTLFALAPGWNGVSLVLRAESGNTNTYHFSVNAATACTLTFVPGETVSPTADDTPTTPVTPVTPPAPVITRGDINGDGRISVADLGAVKFHLLGKTALSGNAFTAADVNKDGRISVADLGAIQFHLLKRINLLA